MQPAKGRLAGSGPSRAAEAFAEAGGREGGAERTERAEREGEILEVRIEEIAGDVQREARRAVRRGAVPVPEAQPERRTRKPPRAMVEELEPHIGGATAARAASRLADAGRAFEAERFADAKRILGPLASKAPASASVRELLGLTLYRLGRWADAAAELEAFRALTGSTEQHPVLADCYRALRRYEEVAALWQELREVSPSADLVAEGRIVQAGALADQGHLDRAIAEIEPAVRRMRKPRHHHQLRLLYVLGDLYERAGDVPHARLLFDRLLAADPEFADAASRRRQL
jgi:tetratricopeptide (TPR) repeat protein